MKKLGFMAIVAGGSLLFFLDLGFTEDAKEMSFPLPKLSPLITPNQCRCESIVNTGLYGNIFDWLPKKEILATLQKGTDKIMIQIEGDELYMLTGASINVGLIKTDPCKIVYQTKDNVLAICTQGGTVDVFTLDRKTGLAVWTKTRSVDVPAGGTPSAQSFYLMCR